MTLRASLSSHVVNNLYEYQKNAAPRRVARIIDVSPVQPKIQGIRLNGIKTVQALLLIDEHLLADLPEFRA